MSTRSFRLFAGILLLFASVAIAQAAPAVIYNEIKRVKTSSGDQVTLQVTNALDVTADVEFTVQGKAPSKVRLKPRESSTPSVVVPYGARITILNVKSTPVKGADDANAKKKGGIIGRLFPGKDKPANNGEVLAGNWVLHSAPPAGGRVDSVGWLRTLNGQRQKYTVRFESNGHGVYYASKDRMVDGHGVSYSWEQQALFSYTFDGKNIRINMDRAELIGGNHGTWTLTQGQKSTSLYDASNDMFSFTDSKGTWWYRRVR